MNERDDGGENGASDPDAGETRGEPDGVASRTVDPDATTETVPVTVLASDLTELATLSVPRGSNLRSVLLEAGLSPYTRLTRRANCGGRGLCATCGVWIDRGAPRPEHWHDRLAERWGFPRLSCQVTVEAATTVRLPAKFVWGWGGRRRSPED